MQRRQLGSTPFQVSPIGLGLAALGRPGYISLDHGKDIRSTDVADMEERTHYVLDTAWEFGVRYFDAARGYGKAEAFLASWFASRGISPDDVVVGSKWGYTYTADWQVDAETHEVKEHSLDRLEQQWEETQATLGEHLNLYQVHSATRSSGVLENDAVLEALFRLKAETQVAMGLTLSGPGQADTLQQALTIRQDGELLFDTVQATWNVLERTAEDALNDAHQAGMGIIVKEALANGRLTVRNVTNDDFAEPYRVIMGEAGRLNTTVDALCIAAALAQPWADVVLSGAAQRVHMISNIAATNIKYDDHAAEALEAVRESAETYWQTRDALEWN